MSKLLIAFYILINLTNNNLYSQDIVETNFYSFKVPEKTIVKAFGSSNEELANTDVYQFIVNDNPKYLLYLISNKINTEVTNIDYENYNAFLSDIGDIRILGAEKLNNQFKIDFNYNDKENIKGIIFISVNNDILNRYVFLLPNEKAKEVFQDEIIKLVNSITPIKNVW